MTCPATPFLWASGALEAKLNPGRMPRSIGAAATFMHHGREDKAPLSAELQFGFFRRKQPFRMRLPSPHQMSHILQSHNYIDPET
jgi:hypothetical protein